MKTKIVLWGETGQDEKILLGIELIQEKNVIRIHKIKEADATETFYNQLMNQWREGQEVQMPEGTEVLDRALTMTEGLLPDDIKTDRQDILARAKTEWHFVILSSKLYEAYADEINQIKERVDDLSAFDAGIWEEMKAFWKKVQNQVQEKNLFREHAVALKSQTNELFDQLKSLKKAMNDEFERESIANKENFVKQLDDIDARIEKGLGLQPIFNELKKVQQSFKGTKFTRKHHNDIWKRIDASFKKVKEKRYGDKASSRSGPLERLNRRYEGLLGAIDKMEQSIKRDVKDKEFQVKRIGATDGQLELQIRQAKMAMIEERIRSKQVKLDDMLSTRTDLEKKIEKETKRAAQRAEKKEVAKEVKKAKAAIKEDIAKSIESRAAERKEDEAKLTEAAAAIKTSNKGRPKKDPQKPQNDNSNKSDDLPVDKPETQTTTAQVENIAEEE